MPVDTHVHQIAIKHYGMSGAKTKTNMTPVLYEQVNTKLVSVWGEYAGWAHSVSASESQWGAIADAAVRYSLHQI